MLLVDFTTEVGVNASTDITYLTNLTYLGVVSPDFLQYCLNCTTFDC